MPNYSLETAPNSLQTPPLSFLLIRVVIICNSGFVMSILGT